MHMRLKRHLRRLALAAMLSLTVAGSVAVTATPVLASWCSQADKFDGHCDFCNAMCFLMELFDMT
jgi:hypothetical protein